MRVIKAVYNEGHGRLVGTFARGKWQKEYAEGVETKPDVGYLFAFSSRNMGEARGSMGSGAATQYWLAEAEVVGRISGFGLSMVDCRWQNFWKGLKLRLRTKGAEYLLCSSITLIKRLA